MGRDPTRTWVPFPTAVLKMRLVHATRSSKRENSAHLATPLRPYPETSNGRGFLLLPLVTAQSSCHAHVPKARPMSGAIFPPNVVQPALARTSVIVKVRCRPSIALRAKGSSFEAHSQNRTLTTKCLGPLLT